ncbi:MAG: hypothetical protein ABJH25_06310 [Marinomonas sp.]
MKKLTAIAATIITASVLSTSAFASSDNAIDDLRTAKASVTALSNTLENLGQTVDSSVDLNGAHTFGQKEAAYNAKHAELQAQFDALQLTSAE